MKTPLCVFVIMLTLLLMILQQVFVEGVGHSKVSPAAAQMDIRFVAAVKIRAAGHDQAILFCQAFHIGFLAVMISGVYSLNAV